MNYDLAMMALEGLGRSPLTVTAGGSEVVIEGTAAALKELARLLLLIASEENDNDAFELQPGVHVEPKSPTLRLRTRTS